MNVLPVVSVREVRMFMRRRRVPVHMVMAASDGIPIVMLMLVVLVMNVFMSVPHGFMGVFMIMIFDQVQPGAECHQGTGQEQRRRDGITHQQGH
jgi:hypothetical protein